MLVVRCGHSASLHTGKSSLVLLSLRSTNAALCMTSRVANSSLIQFKLMKILSPVFSGHSTGVGSSRRLAISIVGTPTQAKQLEHPRVTCHMSHWHGTLLSLSPDGTKLVSASHDGTIRFWDAHSGDPIAHQVQHDNLLWAVAISPSSANHFFSMAEHAEPKLHPRLLQLATGCPV
ncbi:hypothetical protein PAXRUDRAFT_805983 [Paxillus rubicundulus Ve08.2h10]|uniref:Uncharacterized protein n=1 Tax=Paxillus rubicundulus Ve08.2h10 TaxID=930991 RepID=A0A0D0DJY6_9AGAM|nr:hypothetical protein PAXRUDRAFT_805983 [Paxillus rubicundulus Ve08.2h10]